MKKLNQGNEEKKEVLYVRIPLEYYNRLLVSHINLGRLYECYRNLNDEYKQEYLRTSKSMISSQMISWLKGIEK